MAATDVQRPFHHAGWIYEEKVDGWRVLAYKDTAGVRLITRNGRDLTRRFTELAAAVAGLEPPTLLLDGEIAVFDSQLLSHFEWIRARPKDVATTPPTLIASDCLYVRGKDLRARPLRVRFKPGGPGAIVRPDARAWLGPRTSTGSSLAPAAGSVSAPQSGRRGQSAGFIRNSPQWT